MSVNGSAAGDGGRAPAFAMPGTLVVIVVFMIQFMAILFGAGIWLTSLHERGVSYWVLGTVGLAAFVVLNVMLGLVLKAVPVRCVTCRGRSRFLGFRWWPFIYRFGCASCGTVRRFEVGGR